MDTTYPLPTKKERNQSIIQDYKSGMSILEITIKYKVTSARLYQILKSNKIPANNKREDLEPLTSASA